MLREVGGWEEYRRQSAEFAHSAGYRNSVWHLGLVDAPVRYSVKLALAMIGTLGPGLLFLPRGLIRVGSSADGRRLAMLMALPVVPALLSHLLVHFGVAGYGFHYLPAAVALMAIGIGRATSSATARDLAPARLSALAAGLAAVFLFYPADFNRPGWRGDLDLALGRYTRAGLHSEIADRAPVAWRTSNSVPGPRTAAPGLRAN
jgi:4-amino-4-deoxy-L-arabinose transferase-like glycosyltransferase